MAERLIVIGGDGAGMSAASIARRRRPDLEIVALERGNYTSYSACGIPYVVGGEVGSLDELVARTPQQFRAEHRIDVRMGHEVVGIDLDARRVTVRDHGHNRELTLGFDLLHIATGSRPIRPNLPGIDADFVHGVQTLDDAAHLLEHAKTSNSSKVAVVGGGYIGLEMAEAFVRWGAEVTVVDAAPHVMRTFDDDMAVRVEDAMRRHGITVRTGVAVQGFEPGRVVTADGPVEADLVILGIGVAPNSALAAESGLELGARDAIRVDRRQATSAEGVWAAGDCAETFHRVTQRSVHIALGTVANKTGRVAGINLAGGYATFEGVVGTAATRICSAELARTGLTEREAAEAGFKVVTATIEATTRAGYLPGARPLTVKMLAESGTGRVLGCQIVGEEGAAKRIDVVATAITARMTAADVLDLDLSYAPPVSPLWDPVQVAARQLLSLV
ncbi:MAG: FAD-dependent oxidoreductase [Acidimicrobiales bacterium]|nr:FAD-dependent oxidoreductase [Acidimicrobiales bacterium]